MRYSIFTSVLVLRNLMLVALYTVFFTVQLFSMPSQDINAFISSTIEIFQKPQSKISQSSNYDGEIKKTKLGITKRFQHAIADRPDIITEEIPARNYESCYVIKSSENIFVSFILTTSLRGPPSFC